MVSFNQAPTPVADEDNNASSLLEPVTATIGIEFAHNPALG